MSMHRQNPWLSVVMPVHRPGPWLDEPLIVFQETEMMADMMIDEGTGMTTTTQGVVEEEAVVVAAMVGGLKEVVVEGT